MSKEAKASVAKTDGGGEPGGGEPSEAFNVDPEEVSTLRKAELERRLAGPETARSHAQIGSTIAASAGAALVAAGGLTNISDELTAVLVEGIAALALWMVAAASFAAAVLTPREKKAIEASADPVDGAKEAVHAADRERHSIEKRAGFGLASAIAAAAFSVGTVGTAELTSPSALSPARVQLTTQGAATLRTICPGHRGFLVEGRVDFETVGDESLVMSIPGCGEIRLNRLLYQAVLKLP